MINFNTDDGMDQHAITLYYITGQYKGGIYVGNNGVSSFYHQITYNYKINK